MKKSLSLLFMMLLMAAGVALAQSTMPVPMDPTADDWNDREPFQDPDGNWYFSSEFMFGVGMDLSGNPVANDYEQMLDSLITGERTYTLLDPDKVTYSIYTDFDELFVFSPEEYEEFSEPTTRVPFGLNSMHFELWFVHFENKTNLVENIEGMEPFFQWRIGVQTHYTVDGVTTSSGIVYLEVFPRPVGLLGDVNDDGEVGIKDVSALIDYLLGMEVKPFNKFNADVNENNNIAINDVSVLIDMLLS